MVARDSCGELYSGEAAWLARVLVFLSVLYMQVYVHWYMYTLYRRRNYALSECFSRAALRKH